MPKPKRPTVCRTKYLGAAVRLRGRPAKVVGCARPEKRPEPAKPVARFRVQYDASGNVHPVPRRTVYRAARCAAKPEAKGCKPFPKGAAFARGGSVSTPRVVVKDGAGRPRYALELVGGLDLSVAVRPFKGIIPQPPLRTEPLQRALVGLQREGGMAVPSFERARLALRTVQAPQAKYTGDRGPAPEAPPPRPVRRREEIPLPVPVSVRRTKELPLPVPVSIRRTPELPAPMPTGLRAPEKVSGRRGELPLPVPASIRRGPEVPGAWRPVPPLVKHLTPEVRDLAAELAYHAPWAWERAEKRLSEGLRRHASNGEPITPKQAEEKWGLDWYSGNRGFGVNFDNLPPKWPSRHYEHPAREEETKHADIGFVPRPDARKFVEDALFVGSAIISVESLLWSGRADRFSGTIQAAAQTPPDRVYIPPGTHGSTAAAMRRRQEEKNERETREFNWTMKALGQAREIVARWNANPKALPVQIRALAIEGSRSAHNLGEDIEYAKTWKHGGIEWRVFITRDEAVVTVEKYTALSGWVRAWRGRYDTRTDRFDFEGAPKAVEEALKHMVKNDYGFTGRIFGGGFSARRKEALRRFEYEQRSSWSHQKRERVEDPFADCTPLNAVADAWDLTKRIPCANREAREILTTARDAELFRLCNDPHSPECDNFYSLVEQEGCIPDCKETDDAWCDKVISKAQIEAWKSGEEPAPRFVYDSDLKHRVGATDTCYYGRVMRTRRALHQQIERELLARDPEMSWDKIERIISEREKAHDFYPLWEKNDRRVLTRAKLAGVTNHKFGQNVVDDLALAFMDLEELDRGSASASQTLRAWPSLQLADADGEIRSDNVAEELWRNWVEEMNAEGKQVQIARVRNQATRGGRLGYYAAARIIARPRFEKLTQRLKRKGK